MARLGSRDTVAFANLMFAVSVAMPKAVTEAKRLVRSALLGSSVGGLPTQMDPAPKASGRSGSPQQPRRSPQRQNQHKPFRSGGSGGGVRGGSEVRRQRQRGPGSGAAFANGGGGDDDNDDGNDDDDDDGGGGGGGDGDGGDGDGGDKGGSGGGGGGGGGEALPGPANMGSTTAAERAASGAAARAGAAAAIVAVAQKGPGPVGRALRLAYAWVSGLVLLRRAASLGLLSAGFSVPGKGPTPWPLAGGSAAAAGARRAALGLLHAQGLLEQGVCMAVLAVTHGACFLYFQV